MKSLLLKFIGAVGPRFCWWCPVVNAQTGNPLRPRGARFPMGGMMMQRGQNGEGLGIV